MKKSLISLLIAGLMVLSFAGCSNGSRDPGVPVIEELFYTNDLSGVNNTDVYLDNLERLSTIKVNHSKSATYDFKYSMVVSFKDEDIDVFEMHLSWDGFKDPNNEITYKINNRYAEQYSWFNGECWKRGSCEKPLELSAYLVDLAGNQSDIYTFSVATVFGD